MISAFLRGLGIVPQLARKRQMPFSVERLQLSAFASLALRRELNQLQMKRSFIFAMWRRSKGLTMWRTLLGLRAHSSSSLCLLVEVRTKGAGGNSEEGLVWHGRGMSVSCSGKSMHCLKP